MIRVSRTALSILAGLLLVACSTGDVRLRYEFPGGKQISYDWNVRGETRLEGPQGIDVRRVDLEATINERYGSSNPDSARIRVDVIPSKVVEDGIEAEVQPPIAAELEVSRSGRVTSVGGSAVAGPLSSLEIGRLLAETRPPLAPHPVQIGDRWSAPLRISAEHSSVGLTGSGLLDGFELEDRRRLARVLVDRSGPVTTKQQIGRTIIQLTGRLTVRSTYLIDVDEAVVYSSSSTSTARFEVALSGGAPAAELVVSVRSRTLLLR